MILWFYDNDNISLKVLFDNFSPTKYTDTHFILGIYHTSSQGRLSSIWYILVIGFSGYYLTLQYSSQRQWHKNNYSDLSFTPNYTLFIVLIDIMEICTVYELG